MIASELGRTDYALGVLGTGIQERWQVRTHAAVLLLSEMWIWGRNKTRAEPCRAEIAALVGGPGCSNC
jgi:ornithine cyclodeaminase/alanine dehydrogenase-like protein (mu-crystallin family)